MLLKVFKLLIDSLFFHFKTFVVSELHTCSLLLDLVNQRLELVVDVFDVLYSFDLHLFVELTALINQLLRLGAKDIEMPDNLLTIFFQNVD